VKRSRSFRLVPLLATTLAAAPVLAAPGLRAPNKINLTYHGGPLLQHTQVVTLFWGPDWKTGSLAGYFNGFFQALFTDGRFMADLAQYDAGAYTIGNGTFAATATDDQAPPSPVQDADIQAEIRAQIAAGNLPQAIQDTVYYVFTPPQTVVVDAYGNDSTNNFSGYHDYASGSDGFAYAVIPYETNMPSPEYMTLPASHELAEAVTDPEPGDTTLGWYDNRNGEVGDIPVSLYAARRITKSDFIDQLTAPDGTVYQVQKEWSNQANAPVAFAPATGP